MRFLHTHLISNKIMENLCKLSDTVTNIGETYMDFLCIFK